MNSGRTIFAQVMDFLPLTEFRRCVQRYRGDYKVQSFSCWDHFLCLAFAQLTGRESLRDIEACLRSQQSKLYHLGFRGRISRNTLAHANEMRDWRIFADFARALIAQARLLYRDEPLGVELHQTLYALDSTTIDLCLAMFPWAQFRRHKSAVKVHTLLDLRGSIPTNVYVTSGAVHDRHQHSRPTAAQSGGFLSARPRILGLRTSVCAPTRLRFFHHARQTEHAVLAARLAARAPFHRAAIRSDHSTPRAEDRALVSRSVAPHPLLRCRKRSAAGFSDQQLPAPRTHHRRPVSRSLARGVVFSLDQTASAYQVFLR